MCIRDRYDLGLLSTFVANPYTGYLSRLRSPSMSSFIFFFSMSFIRQASVYFFHFRYSLLSWPSRLASSRLLTSFSILSIHSSLPFHLPPSGRGFMMKFIPTARSNRSSAFLSSISTTDCFVNRSCY